MNTLNNILWLVLSIVLQVLVFNSLHLFGGIVLVYLLALIKMPVDTNRSLQILAGFLCGLVVDIFSNTLGMHALTAVTMMWMRLPLLHLYINADDVKTGPLSGERLGMQVFIRYAITVIIVHCILLYGIESFSLFNFSSLLLRVVSSILMTSVTAIALEFATLKK